MAVYYRQELIDEDGFGVDPPFEPLNGLQPMRRARVEAVFRAQDRVVSIGRRIVCSGGMRGSETFFVPDTDPSTMTGTHPSPTDRRLIAAGSVDLTPGCMLRCWAVVAPSGETQLSGPTAGGAMGEIHVDVVWTDQSASTVSTSHVIPLAGSTLDNGAAPALLWSSLHVYDQWPITPGGLVDTSELNRWCRTANVRVLVYAVGGARPIDVCVFEQRYAVAMEADDDGEEWCSHIYTLGKPNNPATPLLYPYQRQSETTPDGDPRAGIWHAADVHHAQHMRLGPVLLAWSGAQESSGETGVEITSGTLVELAGGGSTVFDLTEPGLAVGTGGYARRHSSNSPFVLRDRVAAIPVFVRVYAESGGGGAGSVRVMTRGDSYIDVAVPISSAAWRVAFGWLEVGINPDDSGRLLGQLFASSAGTMFVYAVAVHYAGGYQPAV